MTYKLTNTSQPADPYYGAVSLLLHGDGADGSTTILDNSPSPKTVTAVGNAQISTTQSKWNGSSLKFDGSGDYAATPDSADFYLPNDFTIEGWVYPTSSSGFRIIVAQWRDQGGSDRNFSLGVDGVFYMNRAGTNQSISLGAFSLNQWTHFAVAVENGTCYGFINGVLQDSNSNFTAAANNSTEPLGIGAYGNGDYVFAGYIDDLRITKGVARYTSNFTPPTQPFFNNFKTGADQHFYSTSLLLKGDGTNGSTNIVDSSFDPKTITVNGDAQISTAQSKYGGSSLKFDGTGDYLTTTYLPSAFDWWTSDFTIECWVYATSWAGWSGTASGTLPAMIGNMGATNAFNYWSFGPDTNSKLKFYYFNGAEAHNAVTAASIPTGQWVHIAATKSTDGIRFFIDGTLSAGPFAIVGTPQSSVNQPLSVGKYNTFSINGYIDDLRITKGIARYTSNFTPPSSLPTF